MKNVFRFAKSVKVAGTDMIYFARVNSVGL